MTQEQVSCPICGQKNFALLPQVDEGEPYPELSCPHQVWNPILFPDLMRFCLEYCFGEATKIDSEKLEAHRADVEGIAKRHLNEKEGWLFRKTPDDTKEMVLELNEFLHNRGFLGDDVKTNDINEPFRPYELREKQRERQKAEEAAKSERYLANWQRAQADFTNLKRRAEQERGEVAKFANATLMLNLLPVLDDLDRALAAVSTQLAGLTWVDGIKLIQRKLETILEAQGLSEIEAVGQDFDPNLHEAVMYADGDEGKVIEEVQKGYTLHDRVLRPAMVKVGKGEEKKQESPEQPVSNQEE